MFVVTQGKKRETSTKTCNETMLRDKLRAFVSRISPPLPLVVLCEALPWCSGFPHHEKPALQNPTSRWIHWTTSATTWAKYKTKFESHIRKSYLLQATEKRMVFVKQLRSSSLTAKVIHPRFHKMRIYSLRKAKNCLKKRPRATLSRK